jgi:predicted enzyme related to lactoylglutathione lyase
MIDAIFSHTNLIATDWASWRRSYEQVFGCVPVPPERHYAGPALEAGTGVSGATLAGVHLRLPGHGNAGPTLEIFTYSVQPPHAQTMVNRPGFGHIAFQVPDVLAARDAVLAAGGSAVGDVVSLTTDNGAVVTWCYVTDIEGNAIELQAWSLT